MGGPAPIPPPAAEDDEDVSWALSTASALWARGEAAESLKWLRRAAETASDANRDERAVQLFKAAADMATDVERSKSQMPPAPSQAPPAPSQLPPAPSQAPPPPNSGPMPASGPRASGPPPERVVEREPSKRPPPPPPRKGSAVPPPPMPSPQGARHQPVEQGRAGEGRKAPMIVPPAIAAANAALRPKKVDAESIPEGRPTVEIPSNRNTMAGIGGDDHVTKRVPQPPPTVVMPVKRSRTASRTKGLMSLHAQKTARGERSATATGEKSRSGPVSEPSSSRSRREEEVTAVRDFGLRSLQQPRQESKSDAPSSGPASTPAPKSTPAAPTPATPDVAAFASSFDDEQTNVLGGEESFADLGSTRQDQKPADASKITVPEMAIPPGLKREGAAAASRITSYRVAIVADGSGVQIIPLRPGEAPGPDVPTAIIVPSDAASSEAISQLLGRGDEK